LFVVDGSDPSELSRRDRRRPRGAWQFTSTRPSSRASTASVSGSGPSNSELLTLVSFTRAVYDGGNVCEDAKDGDRVVIVSEVIVKMTAFSGRVVSDCVSLFEPRLSL
jgi:hypothetical protein